MLEVRPFALRRSHAPTETDTSGFLGEVRPTVRGEILIDARRRNSLEYLPKLWEDVVQVPIFNPRVPDLLLGLMIGLVLALGWRWVQWTIY